MLYCLGFLSLRSYPSLQEICVLLGYWQPVFEGLRGTEHQLITARGKNQIIVNYNIISVGYLPVFISALLQSNKTQPVLFLPQDSLFCSRTKCTCPDTTRGHHRIHLQQGEGWYLLPVAGRTGELVSRCVQSPLVISWRRVIGRASTFISA